LPTDRPRRVARVLATAPTGHLRVVVGLWPPPSKRRAPGPIRIRRDLTGGNTCDADGSRRPGGERCQKLPRAAAVVRVADARHALRTILDHAGVAACARQSAQAVNRPRALLRTP